MIGTQAGNRVVIERGTEPEEADVSSLKMLPRLAWIDGLRGIAIGVVLLCHAGVWAGIPAESGLSRWLALGRAGVDLFFVLSGFCLFLPLIHVERSVSSEGAQKFSVRVAPFNLRRYARRRFLRIYPPYFAALLLTICVSALVYRYGGAGWWKVPFQSVFPVSSKSGVDVGAHLLLIHGFFPNYGHTLDGAYWSLSVEMQFYVLLPILVWLGRRYGVVRAIGIPILVTIVYRLVCKRYFPDFLLTEVGNEIGISRWAEFGAGMLAAYYLKRSGALLAKRIVHPAVDPELLMLRSPEATSLPLITLVALVAAICIERWRGQFFLLPLCWAAAFGLLIVLAGSELPMLRRVLSFRPLVKIGTISYSLYLLHGTVFRLMSILPSRAGWTLSMREIYFYGIGLPVTVLVSIAFYRCVELPFLRSRDTDSVRPLAQARTDLPSGADSKMANT